MHKSFFSRALNQASNVKAHQLLQQRCSQFKGFRNFGTQGPTRRDFNASANVARTVTAGKPHLDEFLHPGKRMNIPPPEKPAVRERKLILKEPRVHNFSAGPAASSESVMRKVQGSRVFEWGA